MPAMISITDRRDGGDRPLSGDRVALLSQQDGRMYPATVLDWCPARTPSITARVMVGTGAARRLNTHPVWVSSVTIGAGFIVYAGVANLVDDSTLDIADVLPLVHEQRRRRAPRVLAANGLTVISRGQPPRRGRIVDLSRGGVRVRLEPQQSVALGEFVNLDIELGDGPKVLLRGEVTRVYEDAGEAAVQFDHPPSEARTRIDRFVLARVARAGAATVAG
jgi:PilZ domain